MFKVAFLAAALFCAALANLAARPINGDSDRLVDCGKFKAVIIHGTESKDGRYALGWTLRRINKKAEAINWSLWNGGADELLEHYHMEEVGNDSASDDYSVDYYAVDLRNKKSVEIPADYQVIHGSPYGRGSISAVWSGDIAGKQYGILLFDYIGSTELDMVSLSGKEMQCNGPYGLDDTVEAQLPKNTPLDRYGIYFHVGEDVEGRKLPVFHGPYADIIFNIGIRHDADAPSAAGILTVRLADGKVMHVTRTDGEDDEAEAVRDNPDLKKADAALNAVYLALQKKLPPPAREALKKEQRAWIVARNAAVGQAASAAGNDDNETALRDKAQLESTLKRTAELKSRLTATH